MQLLDSMAAGASAPEAMAGLTRAEPLIAWRQLTAIDKNGVTATWSGERTLGLNGTAEGPDCVVAGNLLASGGVPTAMVDAFAAFPSNEIGDRLIAALSEGLRAGGEAGPVHSAGLVVVDDLPWPVTDLRVDWSDDPIAALDALWRLWKPQADAYRLRALDPASAPGYDVPGDETQS
jgi:uncharacterized Ntn-hydrolase superfamily protein